MKIGILREEKKPQDTRVPLTPSQCKAIMQRFREIEVAIQPCSYRCFTNEEYKYQGIEMQEDLSDCDILLGVKEIPVGKLIAEKKYCFFSHTIKKQPHNQKLLQEIINQKIYTVRNVKVMLDKDLAELYEVETRVLNQAVKRNIELFPTDFMFQLLKKNMKICHHNL